MTPLKGADGMVYGLAQGAVSIGGFNIRSGANNSFRKNHATVGMIPNGAKVINRVARSFVQGGKVAWLLHHPDFNTAAAVVARRSTRRSGPAPPVRSTRSGWRPTCRPRWPAQPVDFIARMGELSASADVAGARGDQRAHRHDHRRARA